MTNKNADIELGLGLIGIGRTWGYKSSSIPEEQNSLDFLMNAFEMGIKFFDTAPAYGLSEVRLGKFLESLDTKQRDSIVVATKFGEFFDETTSSTYVDHSYKALCSSIDQSLERLGRIDILQLHKTNVEVLQSEALLDAVKYAKQKGINIMGASVSDVESGRIVCKNNTFSVIQIPYNMNFTSLEEILDLAKENNKFVISNRPFHMGEIMYKNDFDDSSATITEAFKFIVKKNFRGVILTGTKSPQHLQENLRGFQKAFAD